MPRYSRTGSDTGAIQTIEAPGPMPQAPRLRALQQFGRRLLSPVVIGLALGLAIVAWGVSIVTRVPESRAAGVRRKLEQNADFMERVGHVEDFQTDRPTAPADDDDGIWIYDVQGTKWSGRLTVKHETAPDGFERIVWARMQLPSGEIVDLDVEDIETE